ncbi:NmrA family NAD(P)-binding protein [Photobacterium alginatilyticum]|uniref:NAD-dependent epimerase/dehydratase family protein n=1 Tax=Photobacterium alginatilyticum TaxID=1775171 RepID=A0ABW9YI11_9GAMM|nr:NmrA family NAD(P)-binding protein [Photobacterium alginatilyticum]NBI53207.1 NAD-dependent epimerase/dehydratase family protein [Photobacterium alginatilyticum]
MKKQHVAVIGATGQVGTPLTRGLLSQGHDVTIITRKAQKDAKLMAFEQQGASISICVDMHDVDTMAERLLGVDTLVASVPGSKTIIEQSEPVWLEVAVKAGVKRFVPTEFGCHTQALEMGDGEVFDNKKRFHDLLMSSGIDWTLFYNGGIFDYFLPNLRFFRKITTFGDLELPIYTHDIEDIGYLAALAVTDERTLNKCVQVDYNALSQHEMLDQLKRNWPDHSFEYEHFSSEYITSMKESAGDEVTAKKGSETDKERWGINYAIYVIGKLAAFNEQTLRTSELYPDYVCKRPEEVLNDAEFVFED